jgi:hypothetical protein
MAAMLAKIKHPLPHAAVANAKFLGDFFLGTTLDKNGTQRLEATMVRMRGLAKKVLAKAVVHDPNSLEMLAILRDNPRKMVWSNYTAVDENQRQKPEKSRTPLADTEKMPKPEPSLEQQKRLTPTPAKPRKN